MKAHFRLSPARDFSEAELPLIAHEIVQILRESGGSRVLLEGPVGAGKTTLVSEILRTWGVAKAAEGSPTFPIAHEYWGPDGGKILHTDFYRLRSESELEQTGIMEALWEPDTKVLIEWGSVLPEVSAALMRDFRGVRIELVLADDPAKRSIQIRSF